MFNLQDIFNEIIFPDEYVEKPKGTKEYSSDMELYVNTWDRTSPLEGFPYDAEWLMEKMSNEIQKDYKNYSILPKRIINNRNHYGGNFYKLLEKKIGKSLIRNDAKAALKKPEEKRTNNEKAVIKIYADMNNLGPLDDVGEYLNNFDETATLEIRAKEIIKKNGKEIIKNEEAMVELAQMVVKKPEILNVIPNRVRGFVEKQSGFFDALSDNTEKFKDLAIIAEEKQIKGERIPLENIAALEIIQSIEKYEENKMINERENVFQDMEPLGQEDIDDYKKVIDEKGLPDSFSSPEIMGHGEEDIYSYYDEMDEIFQSNDIDRLLNEEKDEINNTVDVDEKDEFKEVEDLVDLNINFDTPIQETQEIEDEYFEIEKIDDSEENFYQLIQDWEALKVGGQMKYMPDEIQEALANIVSKNQNYYSEIPLDMSDPKDSNNKKFFETLLKKLKGKNIIDVIKSSLLKFEKIFKEERTSSDRENINRGI